MTDDKGANEGPYTFSDGKFNGPNEFTFKVEWGNGFNVDSVALTKEIVKVANIAYAEGRKAMEKDFQELLELANRLRPLAMGYFEPVAREFDVWKKARWIE